MIARLQALLMLSLLAAHAADTSLPPQTEAEKKERAYQEAWQELQRTMSEWDRSHTNNGVADSPTTESISPTNFEAVSRQIFDLNWIHSSFGTRWNEVPPPTIRGSNSVASVEKFISEHGWDMLTNQWVFFAMITQQGEDIRGLPWDVIKERTFRAATRHGILYIPMRFGMPVESSGVAYNPRTNRFDSVSAFKHIGDHWYVWIQAAGVDHEPSTYEGEHK